ncbi:MAG: MFS transporter [Bdellovibrionales bacterium]
MRLQRNLKLIGLFTVLTGLLFHLPILVLYYRDRIDLGYREFLIGEAVWAAAIVLCDVPSGWISDTWKRKHTLASGLLISMMGYALLLAARDFWQVVCIQAILGIGYSFLSGTHTAMLYDSLLACGKESRYRKWESRRQAFSFYAIAAGCIAGGFLYSQNRFLPLLCVIAAQAAALGAVLLMDEPERHKRRGGKHPVADILATAKYALQGHAEVGFLIAGSALLFCSTQLMLWSQQPYFIELHVPESAFGLLVAGSFWMGGLASHLSPRLTRAYRTLPLLSFAFAAAAFICFGAALSGGLPGIFLIMLGGSAVMGMVSPRVNDAINRRVGPSRRATILSTHSFMMSLLFVPASVLLGLVAGHWDIRAALIVLAAWSGVAGLGLAGWNHKRRLRL